MNRIARAVLVVVVFFAAYVFAWLLFMVLGGGSWIGNALALTVAVLVARSVWRAEDRLPTALLGAIGIGAAVFGSIGFIAGFFGPMVFAPEANQGPMLGLFITGPLGALLGAVAGFFSARQAGRP
jgi:hypothetical protein